ncbi:MAG: response regulator [Candidatus Kapabacteria bacterium]|nr:response regulator [Candidatus Kapabacteria bacterium]
MKILIVEDDYITSEVMKEILSSFGECILAEDGEKAVDEFSRALQTGLKFDVIFLDIMMPNMDGIETLNNIREIEKSYGILGLDTVKIIMTTALDDFDNIKSAFHNQCEGYIVKPIEKAKIIEQLQKL